MSFEVKLAPNFHL